VGAFIRNCVLERSLSERDIPMLDVNVVSTAECKKGVETFLSSR